MKIKSISLKRFKRFEDLTISNISEKAKLVVLTGPNGCGKSSLFEGFNFWSRNKKQTVTFDPAYHSRYIVDNWQKIINELTIEFHDFTPSNNVSTENKKAFYIRSAYRHEADFSSSQIQKLQDPLESNDVLQTLMHDEKRTSENYSRIVGEAVKELFSDTEPSKTKVEIRDRLIGQIRKSMLNLFGDLTLSGTGNPTYDGTFRFAKGTIEDFHFKNLSGGEKAAFDLLLDFIIKKETFDNTVFCIDELELHMHTRLQGQLLEQFFLLLPDNCQLWISTHSIGMARKAAELHKKNPEEVAFIDFHNKDFDKAVELFPINPTRLFWENMFKTALDDLAKLVAPANVVFCEGKRLEPGGYRKPAFDAAVYSTIFHPEYPDTVFVSLGGANEVQNDGELSGILLKAIVPGINTWKVFDRDDRSLKEIADLESKKIRVLKRRDLENYLWDDEMLRKLSISKGKPEKAKNLIDKKKELLESLGKQSKPVDDIKSISGLLYNYCKETLSLMQCGNDCEAFARDTLAKFVTPDTKVYGELEAIIFKTGG